MIREIPIPEAEQPLYNAALLLMMKDIAVARSLEATDENRKGALIRAAVIGSLTAYRDKPDEQDILDIIGGIDGTEKTGRDCEGLIVELFESPQQFFHQAFVAPIINGEGVSLLGGIMTGRVGLCVPVSRIMYRRINSSGQSYDHFVKIDQPKQVSYV